MASVASQLIQEITAHAQTDSLEDAREICADGEFFPNNLRMSCTILRQIPCIRELTEALCMLFLTLLSLKPIKSLPTPTNVPTVNF